MKKMKKFVALVLAVTLCVGMSMGVMGKSTNSIAQYKVAASGSVTYGPWFGGIQNEFYSSNVLPAVSYAFNFLVAILSPFIGNQVAQSLAQGAAYTMSQMPYENFGYVYGYIDRSYREVYINGQFAYFQTKHIVTVNSSEAGYIGTYEYIYSGDMLMNQPEELETM